MATNFWICYENNCNYRGPEPEFKHPDGGHVCPKCKSEDACFPWRKFRCLGCGFEEEQALFFICIPDGASRFGNTRQFHAPLDPDPIAEKMEYDCSHYNNEDCDSTLYEQIDDSTEPPKQKLYILRRVEIDGVWCFEECRSKRAMSEIVFAGWPDGMRVAVQRRRYERDIIEASVTGRENLIRAADANLERYPRILLFLPRSTSGDKQVWTTDQWLEAMTMKDVDQVVQAVKAEKRSQRRAKSRKTKGRPTRGK